MTDLVGRTTRGIFRDLMTDSTVGAIATAFQDEGFAPNPDCTYEDTSIRRHTTQSYLDAVDWTDPRHVARFLRVAERLLDAFETQFLRRFHQSLHRDGYDVGGQTGQIAAIGPQLSIDSLAKLSDPSAIREGFDRIRRAISDDPALAVGSAKELVESTAKVVLTERGQIVDDKADLPKLARAAQLALGLDPSTGSGPDGSDGVRRILGGVTTIATGLAELRNRGHGTGHGPATARVGLRPRHAHLAVNAALTWCQLILDTLADPVAPARRDVLAMDELLIARNPDPDSRLPYLIRLPLGDGMVFRTSGTWPRAKALYCYPVDIDGWPVDADIVERVRIRSCARRGATIDLILDRARENRSQIVFTTARGRDAVFWQSPRTRKQARPNVTTPTARAAGIASLTILVDTREQYAYRFATQQTTAVKRALPCGDYGITIDSRLVAAVERKSLADLVSSLINGKLRYAIGDLAALPRSAVVVEDRYSQGFKLDWARPAVVADGLAELQVRWPSVPIVFCETRQLAEEWTYRYLAAAHAWADTEQAITARIGLPIEVDQPTVAPQTEPSTAEVRAWARAAALAVSDRGRLHPEIWQAWRDARSQ